MSRKVETQTRIKNGLPVIARGTFNPGYAGDWTDPPEEAHIEDLEICWLSGHVMSEHLLLEQDYRNAELALLEDMD